MHWTRWELRSRVILGVLCLFSSVVFSEVQLGIDELARQGFAPLKGKRVGLITNPSAVNHAGRTTLQILNEASGVKLVALFGPEHGVYGKVPAGKYVSSQREKATGIWVHSLYGPTRRPTPEMLKGIDVLVYDLQDLGCRSYTYISTLGYAMEEAQKAGIEVMVLDRPNPLGGARVEGPRLNLKYQSFIGLYDVPYVYGLTVGELAEWINDHYLKKPCRLRVVQMSGWNRQMAWEETGLRWVATSPNIPRIESVRGYVATGLLGEAGIHNGANDRYPFEVMAREGLDAKELARRVNALGWDGVQAEPFRFCACEGRWKGTPYSGVRLKIDPHSKANLTAISFYGIELVRAVEPRWNGVAKLKGENREMFDKMNGSNAARVAIIEEKRAKEILASWEPGVERWKAERKPYLRYQ